LGFSLLSPPWRPAGRHEGIAEAGGQRRHHARATLPPPVGLRRSIRDQGQGRAEQQAVAEFRREGLEKTRERGNDRGDSRARLEAEEGGK
jgi:hypothetical protein